MIRPLDSVTRTTRYCRFLALALTAIGLTQAVCLSAADAAPNDRPNVILIMTDDQGYGDVGFHGNTMIQTPSIDALARQSVRLTDYHVDPTCAPTRAALMTGRYSTRTGVWHTIMGRSMLARDETTIADLFARAGYRTGMFGKWHLGDNYPFRPQDRGFQETLAHGGGGVGQTPDYWGNDYFDDTYWHNGQPKPQQGYCTDVFFQAATRFIERSGDQPFFCYIPTNAPHGPYYVAEKYAKPYLDQGVPPTMAHFYGMITNIDENVGRLLARLDALKLADNTIVVFTTDNGTAAGVARRRVGANQWAGFNAGMRGQKGSEYDGGHRVPLLVRWGDRLGRPRDLDQLTAHIDVLPTLAELCGVEVSDELNLDGRSLAPLLRGDDADWPQRTLLVHSQRIEHPQRWRKSAVMTERWRLINGQELYDIQADPGQATNVAQEHPQTMAELRRVYERWWKSLTVRFDEFTESVLGSDRQNPTLLTAHDWHTGDGPVPWNHGHIRNTKMFPNGFWAVDVEQAGEYRVTLRRWPEQVDTPIGAKTARLKIATIDQSQPIADDALSATFRVTLPAGKTRLQTWLTYPDGKTRGAYYAIIERE